jgi:hypothetical protein
MTTVSLPHDVDLVGISEGIYVSDTNAPSVVLCQAHRLTHAALSE